jgi:hypothetical protein
VENTKLLPPLFPKKGGYGRSEPCFVAANADRAKFFGLLAAKTFF